MDVAEVLVFVEHRGARFGVVRGPDGLISLSDSLEEVRGVRLEDHRPAHQGTELDCSLIGGVLPPGAVRAEVVDDCGARHLANAANGAWIVLLEQPVDGHESPVCYRDERGVTVAAPLPPEWPRAPVDDALEPCPACGEHGWDEVLPTDGSRGERSTPGGGMEPMPIVVCRSCGYEERTGSWTKLVRRSDEDPAEVQRRVKRAQQRLQHDRALLAEVDFPIYAAKEWPAAMVGSGASAHGVTSVSVAHPGPAGGPRPALRVETERNRDAYSRSEYAIVRRELEHWLHEALPAPRVERSDAGRTIAWRTVGRERRKIAAKALRRERELLIDDGAEAFTVLEAGERWVAVRRREDLTIVLAATGVSASSFCLAPVRDPLNELLRPAQLGPP